MPWRCQTVFATHSRNAGNCSGERTIGIEREGGAVEDEFVLAADFVQINQRQRAFAHARNRDLQAFVLLAAPIGRTVRHDEKLGAGLGETFDDLLAPDVLADRHADAHAAKDDRPRRPPGGKDALFIEDAVIRQIDLEADGFDPALVEQRIGIVAKAVLGPGQADEGGRAAIGGRPRNLFESGAAGFLEGRFQDEILGRIAGEEQFREDDEIGAHRRRLGAGAQDGRRIGGNIADGAADLGESDDEAVGRGGGSDHRLDLARRPAAAMRRRRPALNWVAFLRWPQLFDELLSSAWHSSKCVRMCFLSSSLRGLVPVHPMDLVSIPECLDIVEQFPTR